MIPRLVVVTGATGFTGPYVVRALRRRFPDVTLRCLVRPTSNRRSLLDAGVTEFAVGDLRDVESLRRAFEHADTLVNVASLGFDWNEALFEAISGSPLRRGVFISTTAILTRLPVASKAIRERGEALVMTSGLQWTILRPTMIYGTARDRNISRLIRFVERSPVIPLVAGHAQQQPIHVEDVATAVAAALASRSTIERTYNLAGHSPMSLEQLITTVTATMGLRRFIIPVPTPIVRALVAIYALVSRSPKLRVEQINRLGEDKSTDYTAAAADFGFEPMRFEDGVRAEIRIMRGVSEQKG